MAHTQALKLEEPKLSAGSRPPAAAGKKIWIDLDNSPHVPFFVPIIKELESRGYSVLVTARDAYQVTELLDLFELHCHRIGRHFGKHKIMKVLGVLDRSTRLLPLLLKEKPDLALSHGSRSQVLAAYTLRIPSVLIMDYEHAHQGLLWVNPTWVICPEIIPVDAVKLSKDHVRRYRGIKEDVYASSMKSDRHTREKLEVAESDLLVTIRPPATEAHYHRPESDVLFHGVVDYLAEKKDVRIVLLPRNARQAQELHATWPELVKSQKVIIPEHAMDGLNLIWHSDFVVSGGGTMNREAAALGVPVYSIFRGKIGAVDEYLARTGRLVLLEDVEDAKKKLQIVKRNRTGAPDSESRYALRDIVDEVTSIVNPTPPASH